MCAQGECSENFNLKPSLSAVTVSILFDSILALMRHPTQLNYFYL